MKHVQRNPWMDFRQYQRGIALPADKHNHIQKELRTLCR